MFDQKRTTTKAEYLGRRLRQALKDTDFEPVSRFHIYRHTLATMLQVYGNDMSTIMAVVGHKTSKISQMYQHQDKLDRSRQALSEIGYTEGTRSTGGNGNTAI